MSASTPPSIESLPVPPITRSWPPPASTLSLPGPASMKSLPPRPTSTSSPPSPYSWSGPGVPWSRSDASVPTSVSATAMPAAAASMAAASTRMVRASLICLNKQGRRAPVAALHVVVTGIARQEHVGGPVAERDLRHDRLDRAGPGAGERLLDRAGLGQELQVLDGREDERELVLRVGGERGRWSQPARVHALAAVGSRLDARRSLGGEEPGVEADPDLLRRDPARERHELRVLGQRHARLLLELPHRRGGVVGVLAGVHRAAREDPRAAHEALLGVALHEQHLGPVG